MRISDRIKPLPGKVLVEILPEDKTSSGGIVFPEHTASPEEVQMTHRRPELPKPLIGKVRAIGAWPKLKNGMAAMPEYGVGVRVVIKRHGGTELHRGTGERLKIVHQDDVLAVIREESPP